MRQINQSWHGLVEVEVVGAKMGDAGTSFKLVVACTLLHAVLYALTT